MTEADLRRTGGCHCGDVQYRCDGELRQVWNCHCERCRRITGHHMAGSACHADHLVLLEDRGLRWYEPAPGVFYGFCGTCGSTLFWKTDTAPEHVSITAGTIDQPSGLRTVAAWYVGEAADYHDLPDVEVSHHTEP